MSELLEKEIVTAMINDTLVDREAEIYTYFEEQIEATTSLDDIAYLFCKECSHRDMTLELPKYSDYIKKFEDEKKTELYFNFGEGEIEINDQNNFFLGNVGKYGSETFKANLKTLFELDKNKFEYYWSVADKIFEDEASNICADEQKYEVVNKVRKEDLEYAIGKDRTAELYIGKKVDMDGCINITELIAPKNQKIDNKQYLHEDEKQQILGSIFLAYERNPYNHLLKTHIYQKEEKLNLPGQYQSKKVFIELDLSKPKKYIDDYIKHLIEEYNKDESPIATVYDIFGLTDDFKQDMDKIVKSYGDKPLSVKLADVFFIYDCYKLGYPESEIENLVHVYQEINIKPSKKANKKISKNTVSDRLKTAQEYIDNKKYQKYLYPHVNTDGYGIEPEESQMAWYE